MATPQVSQQHSGFEFTQMFFLIAVVNVLVIWVAQSLFPQFVVLGTVHIPPVAALIMSSSILAWVCTLITPVFYTWEHKRKQPLAPHHWLGGYLVINAVALWMIARFADIIGLGISSWIVVLVSAAVLDFVQGMAMMAISKK